MTNPTKPNITPNDVIMHPGTEATETSARTPNTGIGARIRQHALAAYLLLVAAPALTSCDKLFGGGDEPKPVVVEEKKDTPEARAEYMKDVKEANLANGTARLTFEPVWVATADGKNGSYFLKPIPVINFDKVKEALLKDAQNQNIPLEKMGFEFYLS